MYKSKIICVNPDFLAPGSGVKVLFKLGPLARLAARAPLDTHGESRADCCAALAHRVMLHHMPWLLGSAPDVFEASVLQLLQLDMALYRCGMSMGRGKGGWGGRVGEEGGMWGEKTREVLRS